MPLYLVEGPSAPVVSLAAIKNHVHREDDTDDDAYLQLLVAAATARLDGRDGKLQRALVAQTWDLKLESFPCPSGTTWSGRRWSQPWEGYCIDLPLPPLLEVVSVKYVDADGAEQTFAAGSYHVVGVGGGQRARIQLRDGQAWPIISASWPEPVTVRFSAGYVDTSESPAAGAVPPPIVQAIKLIVDHLYEHRATVADGSVVEVPMSAGWLLEPFIVYA